MKYVTSYDEFVNEAFDFKINVLHFLFGIGIASWLSYIVYIIYKIHQDNQIDKGFEIIGKIDPVLQNKFAQYEKLLISKFSKQELLDMYRDFSKDNTLNIYLQKIDKANSIEEKKLLLSQVDNYIQSRLSKGEFNKLKYLAYKGDDNYQITPNIVKESIPIFKQLATDFNKFLTTKEMPTIDDINITGSAFYWKDDLEKGKQGVRYGDIDAIITYPLLNFTPDRKSKNEDEEKSLDLYNRLFSQFIEEVKPSYVDTNLTFHMNRNNFNKKMARGLSIIINISKDISFLVDLIPTFGPYKEWTIDRLTPERDFKGITYGRLLSTFEQVFGIEIGDTGVHAWATPSTRKLKTRFDSGKKDIINITRNYKTFLLDTAYWIADFVDIPHQQFKIDPLLKANSGMDRTNVDLETLAKGIRGFINTLHINDVYSKGIFPNIYNDKDAIDQMYSGYMNEMSRRLHNFKYNNIQKDALMKLDYDRTVEAVKHAEEIAKKWLK